MNFPDFFGAFSRIESFTIILITVISASFKLRRLETFFFLRKKSYLTDTGSLVYTFRKKNKSFKLCFSKLNIIPEKTVFQFFIHDSSKQLENYISTL